LAMADGACRDGVFVSLSADCGSHTLFVQRPGGGRISAASSHSRLVSHLVRGWGNLGFGAKQSASSIRSNSDFTNVRNTGGAGARSCTVSRQGVVPPTGAAAPDSARDYYGTVAAHVIQ